MGRVEAIDPAGRQELAVDEVEERPDRDRERTDPFAPVWSVTVRVERYVPAVVPAPVIAPVAALSTRPGGSVPVLAKVYGARPPTALTPVVRGR